MILAPLAGAALVVSVATGFIAEPQGMISMTERQKSAAMEPFINSATECIARAVAADPRFAAGASANLGDLIVDSIPTCIRPVRAMIDGYDRYFGDGTGETFFMGAYLDGLPSAVSRLVANKAR
jgi:hypothetical protein